MSAVDWGTPPDVKRGRRTSKYQVKIDELKDNPGQWAKVMENVNTASARVFTQNGCRVTTRTTGNKDGRVDVWAMYVPEGSAAPDGDSSQAFNKPKKTAAKKAPATKKAAASKIPAKRASK